MNSGLVRLVEELEGDPALYEPCQLRERVAALERLEFFGLDERAMAVSRRLEAANFELFQAIRSEIQLERGAEALLPWAREIGFARGEGYDYLDELVLASCSLRRVSRRLVH